MKTKIVGLFAAIAYWSGLDALFYYFNRNAKRILTFHNVLEDSLFRDGVANGVSSKLSDFEATIDECARKFEFSTNLFDTKTLTITFDDGYLNQYSTAFMALRKRGIPAYLFVAGDTLRGGLVIDKLLHWVAEVPSEYIPGGDRSVYWGSTVWPDFVADAENGGKTVLEKLDAIYPYEKVAADLPPEYLCERMGGIPASALEEIRCAGWKVGHHTQSHGLLSCMDDDAQSRELAPPEKCGNECFSYPYGNFREVGGKAIEKVRLFGYPYAVSNTTEPGEPYSCYFLPRMALPSEKYLLHFELSGLKYFLKYRKLLPKVELEDGSVPSPEFEELAELARVGGDEVCDISVSDGGKIAARALMYAEKRRHHGLRLNVFSCYTGKLHDYAPVFARDERSLALLFEKIIESARKHKCDIISLDNILVRGTSLPRLLKVRRELKVFDSALSGWRGIYGRKSAKRFVALAKKECDYHIEVEFGELSQKNISDLGKLHIRRWRFDYSGSPFEDKTREKQYLNFPGNKLYLRILDGESIIACHYGMVYGDVLLWHTPVINPKYLRMSPLRILLAETARWCETHKLARIDFGLGDETYKDEYCNCIRTTGYREVSLTLKGFAARVIGDTANSSVVRAITGTCKDCVCMVLAQWRRMAERWRFFESEKSENLDEDELFFRIDKWEEFCDFAEVREFPIFKWQYERFKNDDSVRFVCLADDKEVFSYGWETLDSSIVKGMPGNLNGKMVFFDFATPEKHRHKGWYTRLLKRLKQDGGAIYANQRNVFSCRAILAAGFSPVV